MTKMNFWKDMKSIAPERRQQAAESLAAFRAVMKEFQAQQEYLERKEREERDRVMQEEREARGRITQLDHAKLQGFRDEFDAVYILKDKKERGDRFTANDPRDRSSALANRWTACSTLTSTGTS
jgi:hypothetical protein